MDSPEARPPRRTGLWLAVTGAGQAWRFLISLLSAVVLGRLLLPSDFGLLATLGPIIAVVELIRDLGFSQAIVQRKEITSEQANGLFWISMAVTAFLSVVLLALSRPAAATFHEPRLVGLLVAQSFSMLLSTSSAQAFAFLNRQLRFDMIALTDGVGATVGFVVSVAGAALTHSYWSIFIGGVVQTAVNLALASVLSGWRPGRPVLDRHVFDMAKFGAGVSLSNFCTFLSRNSDNLLIARAYGPVPLGLYDRSYKLMLLPLTQVTWPVARVLVPVLSRSQDDPDAYRSIYFRAITALMLIAQPGVVFAAIYSRPLIDFLLGPRWSGAAPIFSWLALAGVHQLVTGSFAWLLISQGRARALASLAVFTSLTTVVAFLIGLPYGPVGVAAAYAISDYLIRLPATWLVVGRQGPVRAGPLWRAVAPHVWACVLAASCLFAVHRLDGDPPIWRLLLLGVSTYVIYSSALAVSADKRSAAAHFLAGLRGAVRLGRRSAPLD